MSFKYELLKKLVVAAGLKKRWLSVTTEELLEDRRKQNAYMQGFHRIRYERTTAVSEGAECCDYRLRFDPEKK